ncbi:hypothetical protein ARMSODRAFT_965628 [Armillaria solidipes]|uniref:Uncharacterized protein n=1 Tax=Armillaria solidipes TaxID=1076256 RepID=A0A2H3APN9_9AGAR|nr:hypothetical protein ARMSODRAFT_965628 [Armillaria solidipes]
MSEFVHRSESKRPARSYHPYPRDPVDITEPRTPIKHIHQLLNYDSGPLLAVPSQGIVQREPSSSPLLSPVPVSSSEDESDDEDEYDDYDDDEDGSVAYEEILSETAMLRSSSFDRSRGEVDVLHAVRAGSSFGRSVANGLQSFLGETLAPVIRASSSRLHHDDADSESATSISSHPERVRDSRTRNDISRDPYIVLFYGDEEESSQDSYLVEEVTSEFLEIQDNQVILRMEQLLDWWLALLALDGTTSFSHRMTDFVRFVRRHQNVHFSTNSYPAYYKNCWREVRPLGTHTAYANGVPHLRTGCPWSVRPANATHIATRDACHRWKIDPDESDIFVVFAVAEVPRLSSPSVQPYQAPAITAKQEDPHNAFYVVPPETRSFLYTSTSLRPPATASWIRSYHNPPPRHTWDTEFADLALILRKLQRRPYTTCYKHYAIVWFQHEMCKAMGLQAIYGSQGGMDDVADWLTEQKQAGIKLLGVKRSTIQNWKAKVYSNTESLYVKFKSFIEKGGRIPPESERLYITVKVWATNDPGAMIERGGFYTDEESIAMNAKGSGHLGAMTDEHFAAQVAAHLKPGATW